LYRWIAMPLIIIGIMFWIKLVESNTGISFSDYGIYPKSLSGLKGLFFSQFIHGDWKHLIYNSIPFFFATLSLFMIYPKSSINVFMICFFIPGIFVWLLARESFHIGLSGVNYALLAFLFVGGLIRRDSKTLSISLLVVFLYGTLIIGLFPVKEAVSYESHIAGTFVGIISAFLFRKIDPRKKFTWEEEELIAKDEFSE
jgi:membrane associated rhomboid family serine protease